MRNADIDANGIKIWETKWETDDPQITALSQYLVESKRFHPHWSQWVVTAISLADVPGVPPANKDTPDMTHEILIISVNPDVYLDPDVVPTEQWMMAPVDLVKQVSLPSDDEAKYVLKRIINQIASGRMSPDQDYRNAWKSVIDAIVSTNVYGKNETKH